MLGVFCDFFTNTWRITTRRPVKALEYYTKEPSYAATKQDLFDWAYRCSIGATGDELGPNMQRWYDRKVAELEAIEAQRSAISAERGLDELCDALDAADDAEHEAWNALICAKPADMAEAGERAAYLLSLEPEPNGAPSRLTYWLEEFLTSLLPGEGEGDAA